jgi:ribosome maturation factor RimP
MSMVLTDLANLNQKKITGKTLKYKKQFSNSYGSEAKMRFDKQHDNSKKRVCQLSARTISKISNRARAY